jgi:hypothetical protein
LHLFENLNALINKLFSEGKDLDPYTQDVKYELESSEKLSRENFEWMWEYFCNYREPFLAAHTAFWKKVQSQTDDRLNQLRNPGPPNEPDNESTAELDVTCTYPIGLAHGTAFSLVSEILVFSF